MTVSVFLFNNKQRTNSHYLTEKPIGSQGWCYINCGYSVAYFCGMETYGIVHILPVTKPSSHFWCRAHDHMTNTECLVAERLVAALCLIHVCSVWKARQSAPYGLCNVPLRSTSGFSALLVTAVPKKNLELESWGKSARRSCRASTRHLQENGKRREEI